MREMEERKKAKRQKFRFIFPRGLPSPWTAYAFFSRLRAISLSMCVHGATGNVLAKES